MEEFLKLVAHPRRGSQCWYSLECKHGVAYRLTTSQFPFATPRDLGLPSTAKIVAAQAQTYVCPTHAILTMEEEKAKGNYSIVMEELPFGTGDLQDG